MDEQNLKEDQISQDTLSKSEEHESVSFSDLEANFKNVIADIVNDKSLDSFRSEYQKLYDAFNQSHSNNQALLERCKELNNEIATNSVKIQEALKYSQDDQQTIANLRQEFERAWSNVESLRERERRSKDIIISLKGEIEKLSTLAEKGHDFETEQNISMQDAKAAIKELKKETNANHQIIQSLQDQLKKEHDQLMNLTNECNQFSLQKDSLDKELVETDQNILQIQEESNNSSDELIKLKEEETSSKLMIVELGKKMEAKRNDLFELERNLYNQNAEISNTKEEHYHIECQISKLHSDLRIAKKTCNHLESAIESKGEIVQKYEEEIQEGKKEDIYLSSSLASAKTNIKSAKELHDSVQNQLMKARRQISEKEDKIIDDQRKIVFQNGQIQAVNRKIDATVRSNQKLDEQVCAVQIKVKEIQSAINKVDYIRALEKYNVYDLNEYYSKIQGQYAEEKSFLADMQNKYSQATLELDQIQKENNRLDGVLAKIKKQIEQREINISQIKYWLESDKRNLEALNKSIENQHGEVEILDRDIFEMREEIKRSDKDLLDIHLQLKRIEIQCNQSENSVVHMQDQLQSAELKIINLEKEKIINMHLTNQAEDARNSVQYENHNIKNEMDRLNRELAKRDRERDAILEKSRVYSKLIEKGSSHYEKEIDKIDLMHNQLIKETNLKNRLFAKLRSSDLLKQEEAKLKKKLLELQVKESVLQEEHNTPRLIHRWILMESTDPDQLNLIHMKNQLLDQINLTLIQEQRILQNKLTLEESCQKLSKDLKRKDTISFTPIFGDENSTKEFFLTQYEKKTQLLAKLQEKSHVKQEAVSQIEQEVNNTRHEYRSIRAIINNRRIQSLNLSQRSLSPPPRIIAPPSTSRPMGYSENAGEPDGSELGQSLIFSPVLAPKNQKEMAPFIKNPIVPKLALPISTTGNKKIPHSARVTKNLIAEPLPSL